MKRPRMRILRHAAVFCALMLLLTIPSVPASAAADVYFTSVNDKLLVLSADTMPEVIGGILYVPYTVFDGNSTGVNLGIFCYGNKTQNTFVIYSRQKTLVFDLSSNSSYDSEQNTFRYMAVTRNNRLYLPASFICDFFSLTFSYTATDSAPLIRIKNADVVLSDKTFVSAADSLMQSRYNEYTLSLNSSTPDTPAPNNDDNSNPTPTEETPVEEVVSVHLSFLCSRTGNTEKLLDALDGMDMYGLFLFSPQNLADNDDLVRRILGSGHAVGLTVPGSTEKDLVFLKEGNRLLRVIARSTARIVFIPGLTDNAETLLGQEGWTCWTNTINGVYTSGSSYKTASKINSQLDKQNSSVFLQMDDSDLSVSALPRILRHLDSGGFSVCKTFETLFSCS